MEKLNQIGRSQYRETKKLSELEQNVPYAVSDAKFVKTKFGEKIVVTLNDEFNIFLPDRYNKSLSDEEVRDMIGLELIYKGTEECGAAHPRHLMEFKRSEE